jgi:hypothetical protein
MSQNQKVNKAKEQTHLSTRYCFICEHWSAVVEPLNHNPEIIGSNPAVGLHQRQKIAVEKSGTTKYALLAISYLYS